jgi:uncharacterized protein (DUF58 family)
MGQTALRGVSCLLDSIARPRRPRDRGRKCGRWYTTDYKRQSPKSLTCYGAIRPGTRDGFDEMKQGVRTVSRTLTRFWAQTRPRGRGTIILFAIILFLAIATGEAVLYRVSYFLMLVLVASYVWVRLKLWRVDMRMSHKSYVVQVGDMLKDHVYVRNASPLPTGWVEIMQMSNIPGNVSGIATALGAREQSRLEIDTFCHVRGVYTIGPLVARTSDPLGLFQVQIIQGSPIKVMVQPPIVALPYFRLPVAERLGEESARYRSQTRTPHVATVREYIHGDGLNQIHWLSTAKTGQLMSKEFDSGGTGDVWVVLDMERKIQHSQGVERTDEYAVAIAASLVNLALTEEHSVGFIAHGDNEYLLPLKGGSQQMSRVLETLTLSKTEGDAALAGVLIKNARQFGRSASLLVVTSSTATEWIPVLRELGSRGLNIVVVLVDPASFGGKQALDEALIRLVSLGIPAYVVRRGQPLSHALSRPITLNDLPAFARYGKPEQIPVCETQ